MFHKGFSPLSLAIIKNLDSMTKVLLVNIATFYMNNIYDTLQAFSLYLYGNMNILLLEGDEFSYKYKYPPLPR